jgi:hypothetical protein
VGAGAGVVGEGVALRDSALDCMRCSSSFSHTTSAMLLASSLLFLMAFAIDTLCSGRGSGRGSSSVVVGVVVGVGVVVVVVVVVGVVLVGVVLGVVVVVLKDRNILGD